MFKLSWKIKEWRGVQWKSGGVTQSWGEEVCPRVEKGSVALGAWNLSTHEALLEKKKKIWGRRDVKSYL